MNDSKLSGYITLKYTGSEKKAYFGMPFIKNIKEQGLDLTTIGESFIDGADEMDQIAACGSILYAAFKAYDEKHDIEVDYTIEDCIETVLLLDDGQTDKFLAALTFAVSINESVNRLGKLKRDKSSQK